MPKNVCAYSDSMKSAFNGTYSGITNVVVLSGVVTIGKDVFSGFNSLKSITIPSSVETIGDRAFTMSGTSTSELPFEEVHIEDLSQWCSIKFGVNSNSTTGRYYSNPFCYAKRLYVGGELQSGDLEIPEGVTNISARAFYNCDWIERVTIPASVKTISTEAFYDCDSLKEVVIESSDTVIGNYAFYSCGKLSSIVFKGNAPSSVGSYALNSVSSSCTAYVEEHSTGWDVTIPGKWKGIGIEYHSIPIISGNVGVSSVLEDFADGKLSARITDKQEYDAYRTWAKSLSGVTLQQVKDSPVSWLSYALGCKSLIAADPKEGDLMIEGFGNGAADGKYELVASVDGISVGDGATDANLRKVFDIEGASAINPDGVGFSADNVEVSVAEPSGGKVKFSVAPKLDGGKTQESFFFKVKMK